MIIGKARRPVSSRTVPYRIVPSSVAETLPDRCEDVAEPLHEGLLLEHLEGQHDQSTHGSWAAAGGGMGGGQGDAGTTGALVARFDVKTVRRPYKHPESDPYGDVIGGLHDQYEKATAKISRWQKGLANEQNELLRNGDGTKSVEALRTDVLTLMSQRERSGLYDPAKGTVDEQVASMRAVLDPIETEVRMLSRAAYGASLLQDAMLESWKDEKYANLMDLAQPFSSFIMHPDMPDVPVAGGHGYLRMFDGKPDMLEMSHFGSTNIVDGAGTAIMADFLEYAADNGVGMQLIRPVSDAVAWYTRFGFDYNGDSMKTMEMSADQVKEWVANYKKGKGETK